MKPQDADPLRPPETDADRERELALLFAEVETLRVLVQTIGSGLLPGFFIGCMVGASLTVAILWVTTWLA